MNAPRIPGHVRQLVSLVFAVLTALLYVAVLGTAIIQTLFGSAPQFNPTAVRVASLLSGLVGAVVAAGFARSEPGISVTMTKPHPLGGQAMTSWSSIQPPSLAKRNLLGLADTLGVPTVSGRLPDSRADEPVEEPRQARAALWVSILYLAAYFVVGFSALAVSLWIPDTPDLIVQSGWVWIGTAVTSAYAFFSLSTAR